MFRVERAISDRAPSLPLLFAHQVDSPAVVALFALSTRVAFGAGTPMGDGTPLGRAALT
jgi:hypothetical protein